VLKPRSLAARSGITWMTKDGLKKPNYWGSLTQAATVRLGNYEGEEVRDGDRIARGCCFHRGLLFFTGETGSACRCQ
jgi:hypothetical protein